MLGRKALLSTSIFFGLVLAVLAWTSVASASTASVVEDDFTYAAAAGETNHAVIFRSLEEFWIVDTGATVTAEPGARLSTHTR